MAEPFSELQHLPWVVEAQGTELLSRSAASRSWLLDTGKERVVLRQDRARAEALGLDRSREFQMMQIAFRAGLAPEPLHWEAATGVFIRRYVEGESWVAQDTSKTAGYWAALGALLRRVHALPAPPVAILDIGASALRYAACTGVVADAERAQDIQDRATALIDEQAPVCCHHDAHLGNVIGPAGDETRALLIDWEYASPGHPLFDLAVVAGYHQLSAEALASLVAGWAGDRAPCDPSALPAFVRLYNDLAELWARAMEASA